MEKNYLIRYLLVEKNMKEKIRKIIPVAGIIVFIVAIAIVATYESKDRRGENTQGVNEYSQNKFGNENGENLTLCKMFKCQYNPNTKNYEFIHLVFGIERYFPNQEQCFDFCLNELKANIKLKNELKGLQDMMNKKEDWTLSLYRDGTTLMRLEYQDLQACQSAGNSYLTDKSIDRFDCGLNCEKSIDLMRGIMCERVCNSGGCR